MITEDTLAEISMMFCGDTPNYYSYKNGLALVKFFNTAFGYNESYVYSGFPSRWRYVTDKLLHLQKQERIESFFRHVVSINYILSDLKLTTVKAAEFAQRVIKAFNEILAKDKYLLIQIKGVIYLRTYDEEFELIGSGGFAEVYLIKSLNIVQKRLREEYLSEASYRSRFKREYEITKSLQDVDGIIPVYDFNPDKCEYTMARGDLTLQEYVESNVLDENECIDLMRSILRIMQQVHEREIIHRDLSPRNILLIDGKIQIADFGLGKNLNVIASHQTLHTNGVGQYYYCAPEQFMMLKEGDQKSDVFSLGRILNFLMTGSPQTYTHSFRVVAEKAANSDAISRYSDAGQMLQYLNKSIEYKNNHELEAQVFEKILMGQFDSSVEHFFYEMDVERFSKLLLERKAGFSKALLWFMSTSENNAINVVRAVEESYTGVCGRSFSNYDPFADFSFHILIGEFSFVVKEKAAGILRHVAVIVNRYHAQDLVEKLKNKGIEPLLEEILDS